MNQLTSQRIDRGAQPHSSMLSDANCFPASISQSASSLTPRCWTTPVYQLTYPLLLTAPLCLSGVFPQVQLQRRVLSSGVSCAQEKA